MSKEKLFKRYAKIYDELCKIDEELSTQCRKEIQEFLDKKEFDEAKRHVHMFYRTKSAEGGNFDSLEKDSIYHSINLLKAANNG